MRTISQLFDLTGRVAIVTGGSRGLGLEMAEGLAEAGARLMLCARRREWLDPTLEGMRARGLETEGMLCDVSNKSEVEAVVAKTRALRSRAYPWWCAVYLAKPLAALALPLALRHRLRRAVLRHALSSR